MIKISVVVPIYNAENFIVHLLDKIYKQTLTDFELICVNDGSSDNTEEILENYASKHNNMRVINQTNGGIGKATNTGINHATGKYLLQLDHDDSLNTDEAFEILYKKAEEYDLEILSFNFSTEAHVNKLRQPIEKLMTGKEYLLGGFHPALWSKFCRIDFLNKINFRLNEHLRFVDTEAYPRLMIHAQRVMHIDDVLYFFRTATNKESVSDNIMNTKSAIAFYETAATYNQLIDEVEEIELIKALKTNQMANAIGCARILGSINSDESREIYTSLLALNWSPFELLFIKNEYKFFYYKYIKKDPKILHPLNYIIRRIRKLQPWG